MLDSSTMTEEQAEANYEQLMNAANCLSFGTCVGIDPEVEIKEVSVKEYVEHEYRQLHEELARLKASQPKLDAMALSPAAAAKKRVEELNAEIAKLQTRVIVEEKNNILASYQNHEQELQKTQGEARLRHEKKLKEKLAKRRLSKPTKKDRQSTTAAPPPPAS